MDTLKEFLRPELIWFLIGLALFLLELTMPGLIVAFFGIGAWVVAVLCLSTTLALNTQLLIFLGVSVVSLVVLRKWLKGIFFGHIENQQDMTRQLSEFEGHEAVVKQTIAPHKPGKIELNGTLWTAAADELIEENTTVIVIKSENLTLKVRPV